MSDQNKEKKRKTLETERLILRPCTFDDAEALYKYAKNPNVGPAAGWAPHKDVEESRRIIETIFMPADARAIILKSTGEMIGTISLEEDRHRPESNSREMGYSLAEEHWGKGIMTEAARRILAYAFTDLKLSQVAICTSPVNKRSQGVIKKCGFVYEGTIRRAYKIWDGSLRDSRCYSMLKDEWLAGCK